MPELNALDKCRRQVIEDLQFIDFAGIPLPKDRSGQYIHIKMPLDQMYIRILAIMEEEMLYQEEKEIDRIKGKIGITMPGSRARDGS